ncbi:hypothetical protein [Micromonospora sp. WMMD1082]|uniref:hypothetical protein n=1 Tax=Micromonospora sp. WMMD1082 TaxID=3016104 RepID=UPI002415F8E6|nr:hypothetical protein [Micromonospora sp. WMMD1082]MDG4796190.1 hypothetical protein [Micromonospora sp. WMMD1082]
MGDELTCDPCHAGRCHDCQGICTHQHVSDEWDPADDERPVETVELDGISR